MGDRIKAYRQAERESKAAEEKLAAERKEAKRHRQEAEKARKQEIAALKKAERQRGLAARAKTKKTLWEPRRASGFGSSKRFAGPDSHYLQASQSAKLEREAGDKDCKGPGPGAYGNSRSVMQPIHMRMDKDPQKGAFPKAARFTNLTHLSTAVGKAAEEEAVVGPGCYGATRTLMMPLMMRTRVSARP